MYSTKNSQRGVFKLNTRFSGFTIVELLVVIVVIGILASITIVSYTGVSDRAKKAALQSDMANSTIKLKSYQVQYGSYPTSLDSNNCPAAPYIDTNYCLKSSSGNQYVYNANNTLSIPVFYLKNNNGNNVSVIEDGAANMILNSDFETDTNSDTIPDSWSNATVWSGGTGTASLDDTTAVHGNKSYKLTKTNSTGQLYVVQTVNINPGSTYTYSCWVKSNTVVTTIDAGYDSVWSNAWVSGGDLNQWTRLSTTFTNTTTTSAMLRLGIYSGSSGTATFDYCQLVNGTNPFS